MNCKYQILAVLFLSSFITAKAQNANDSVLYNATISTCVQYALTHQPVLQQVIMQKDIVDRQIKSRTSIWYPQIEASAGYQYNFQLSTIIFNDNTITTGQNNSSNVQFMASQTLFNRDAFFASRTGSSLRTQANQDITANQIDVVVNVGKAFYDVLLTIGQLKLVDDDILRLERSLKDAYQYYKDGLVDPTDYKRATILLNNAKAQKKQYVELLNVKHAALKGQMGYPSESPLTLAYDSIGLVNIILLDTTAYTDYTHRIEYQQLQTQKKLQQTNLSYNKWSYIPSLSLFGAYNLAFNNNDFSELYKTTYPSSYAGVTLSIPIFQGLKRHQDTKAAELQLKQLDYSFAALQSNINTEYQQSMAAYKSYYNAYLLLKENVRLANEVYDVINLQYKAGVKTYLDVTTAETDLRNAQQSYIQALFQTLSSKLDVQRALGTIEY